MKNLCLLMLFVSFIANTKSLPVEFFAADPKFIEMKISPDGKNVAFTYKDGDEYKVGIMNLKTKAGPFSFGMGPGREAAQFHWANDERLVILSRKVTSFLDGSNTYPELFSVNKDGSKREMLWDFQRSN